MADFSPLHLVDDAFPAYWKTPLQGLRMDISVAGNDGITIRDLLFWLRDMPYARPKPANTVAACITQRRGTCSAKHLAAHELLTLLGLQPRLWMASYRLDFQRPYYSQSLKDDSDGIAVYDVHNYLTCDLGNGPLKIDITFPAYLAERGFPVTKDWNGHEDFVLCCTPEESVSLEVDSDPDGRKRDWLNTLNTRRAQALRERAIQEMMDVASWLS